MTREEAIKGLKVLAKDFSGYKPNEEMFDMAIKALERTECEDAVSKEAVSSWLKQYGQDVLHGKYKFSLMYIWKKLMDLPSVMPKQPGWIPIGVPMNSGQHYLVTLRQKFEGEETYRVRIMRFREGHWVYPHHFPEWINDEMEQEVVAWMPLPKPYREGGRDNGKT